MSASAAVPGDVNPGPTRGVYPSTETWIALRRLRLLDEYAIREFLHTAYPRLVAAVGLLAGSRALAEDAVRTRSPGRGSAPSAARTSGTWGRG